MPATYSYDASKIPENGVDRMRFELGDTEVDDDDELAALADEEIAALLQMYDKDWDRAKLACLESICRRMAYEPDTTTGPLSLKFGERAKLWRQDYDNLKAEVNKFAVSAKAIRQQIGPPPYFRTGMMSLDGSKRGQK